jgi:hypothetical protein
LDYIKKFLSKLLLIHEETIYQNLIKFQGEIDKSKGLLKYFGTFISVIDRTYRQKTKSVEDLSDTNHHLDIANIYRTVHQRVDKWCFQEHIKYLLK